MAKKTEQTNTRLPDEIFVKLLAISFYQGYRGEYSPVIRNFLSQSIERFEANLDERARVRYEEILRNVQESEAIRKATHN